MNSRQKLVQKQFLNNEQEVINQLEQIYTQSAKDINDEISNLNFDINGLKLEYSWMDDNDPKKAEVKSKIQSKIYQKQYQEQLQKQVGDILQRMHVAEFTNISDYLDTCYTDGFIGTVFDAFGQGVPFVTPIDQKAMVRAVQLESKISKGLYTRLGEDVNLLKRKITAEISRGISTGMSYSQVARNLSNQSRIGYNKAIRIARTEGHRIQTTATMDAMEVAKSKGADVVKQWDATLDGKTRDSHSQVDGEIRELDKPFSNGLMYPGDPSGKASEVVNCRCALLQRARWALDDGFTKWNNFTKKLETFDSPDDYNEFKKTFFSPENKRYMQYVQNLEDKYGTKNFKVVLGSMSDKEYAKYTELLGGNSLYNRNVLTNAGNNDKIQLLADINKAFTEPEKKAIENVPRKEGYFDFAAHGTANSIEYGSQGDTMSARDVATIIRHNKAYNGQKVRLLSCSTGSTDNGFAQQLANALGVEVEAPTDILLIYPNGAMKVGYDGKGKMKTFKPGRK